MVNAERIPNGYRITEAGILPAEWQVKRLSEVATELTERAGQDMYETVSISAGIGFVNQAEKFGKELSGKQYEKYIVLHKGDFSYNKGNSKTSPQGCIYRLNDRESAAVPNVFESFRIKEQDADYYEQLFLSGFLNKQLYSRINRGVRDDGLLNLTGKDFYGCMVPVPPKDEQKRIAEVLLCCDRVIDLKQQLIAELQRLKNGFLQTMFPTKGRSKPNIRFPGFVDAWEQRKLGDIVDIYDGVHQTPDYQDSGIMFLSVENISTLRSNKYISVEAFERDYKVYPEKGDILMTRIGDIGTTNVVESTEKVAFYVSLALLKAKTTNPYFLSNAMKNEVFQKGLRQRSLLTAIPQKINKDEIGKTDIFITVNPKEQEKIGEYFKNIDNLITLNQRELEEMKKKKKSLAKLLLTGGVRVPT